MYRLAYCYVKNEQDALDIVGESVCRGLIRLGQLRKQEQFEPWLNRIVINTALDFLRWKKRHPTCWDEEVPEISYEEDGLSADERIDLYEMLDRLQPEERTYIILRFFEERSFKEMAEILQLPETTVKSRIYRLLAKLQKLQQEVTE